MRKMAICAALALATAAPAKKTVTILHTNDTHSCIMPLGTGLKDTLVAGRGGFLRRMELIRGERDADPGLLLIDSGDFSQGSPFYTMFKGDVEVELMNRMGYDAATIGNHEFDFGLENMARIFRMADFPIVCSNYDFTGTVLQGIVKPYAVIERGGVRVGLFGLGPKLEGLVFQDNYRGVEYLDPVEKANETARLLRSMGCDIVVCISHLGWKEDFTDDSHLAANTRGIDLILGGHSHSYFQHTEYVDDLDGRPVAIDQNGKHGAFVGKLTLSLGRGRRQPYSK